MKPYMLVVYLLLMGLTLFYYYPILVIVLEGFDTDISPLLAPGIRLIGGVPYYSGGITPSLVYYLDMFGAQQFHRLILNSLVIGGGSTLIAVLIGLLSSYGLTFQNRSSAGRYDFAMLMMRSVPPFLLVIPLLITLSSWGLWDTHLGMVLAYLTLNAPIAYLIIRSLMSDMPRELVESAMVMGCGPLTVVRRVILPVLLPGVLVTVVFMLVLTWNEFLLASLLTGPDARTVSVGVWAGVGEQIGTFRTVEFEAQAAAGTVALIPAALLILLIRRRVVRLFTFSPSQ
ncbi:MAG: carbohydrate ABC transporter permease [Candidatus Caldarchaeum sp.]|nr:carbohydrate ABC transporter permease [Candidatus Caldarchaeum sp.]MDW7977288.1 carbohydrate ABC transporter permease [Candidatus Caldarchaeum sp.]